MRAGASGRLYGSVTNAIIADELSNMVGAEIDRRTVVLEEPIRELGLFDVRLRLHQDVDAQVEVLVYAMGTDPDAVDAEDEEAGEDGKESKSGDSQPAAEEATASTA